MSHKIQSLALILRAIPNFMKGKTRLAKILLKPFFQQKDIIIQLTNSITFTLPNIREPIGFYLVVDGFYEKLTYNIILSQLKNIKNPIFLDIGANIGAFAIPTAHQFGDNIKVIAVKASPTIFPYLKINKENNFLSNIKLIQCAIFDQDDKEISFYQAPEEKFGMGSLAPQFHQEPILVKTKTIDTLMSELNLEHVHLIKIDIEGYEASAFLGAKKLLSKEDAPIIIFEFCDWAEARAYGEEKIGESQKILKDFGYQIYKLSDFQKKHKKFLSNIQKKGCENLIAIKL